jgi:hypothetical protein
MADPELQKIYIKRVPHPMTDICVTQKKITAVPEDRGNGVEREDI